MAPTERGGGSGAAGVDGFGGGADLLANVIVGFVVGLACLDAGFDEGLACLAVAALLPNVSGESRAGTSSFTLPFDLHLSPFYMRDFALTAGTLTARPATAAAMPFVAVVSTAAGTAASFSRAARASSERKSRRGSPTYN
uniref:Uncharacterized protein n=1 Tax=Chrysotila carterae TaxID=13221 RepID=A0A7S4BDU4_CHRCT